MDGGRNVGCFFFWGGGVKLGGEVVVGTGITCGCYSMRCSKNKV